MTGQVVLPLGMLVPLLRGTRAGDECLERLGVATPGADVEPGLALEDARRSAGAAVAEVLAAVRSGISEALRCVQISSGSGSLRAVLVFSRDDEADVAVVAAAADGLHVAVVGPAALEALIVEAAASCEAGDLHASLWVDGTARAALTM